MKKLLLAISLLFISSFSFASEKADVYTCRSTEIYDFNGEFQGRIPKKNQEKIDIKVSEESLYIYPFILLAVNYIDKDGNYVIKWKNGGEFIWYPKEKKLAFYDAEEGNWYMYYCKPPKK